MTFRKNILHSLFFITCFSAIVGFSGSQDVREVSWVNNEIQIDGIANESVWKEIPWFAIDQAIIGAIPEKSDFSARYKLAWNQQYLFILAEIIDDKLYDGHPVPTENYWDDDCLEIFIDEDASGGNHQFNFNAFAYHIALDNQVVDIGEKDAGGQPQFLILNSHALNRWRRSTSEPKKIIWEVALSIYDDRYKVKDSSDVESTSTSKNSASQPVTLTNNKTMGFMIAYCDNDGSKHRESFVGSLPIEPVNGDKNRGYIDASVFGKIRLVGRNKTAD